MPSDNPEMLYLTAQTHYLNPQMLYLMAQTCHMSPQILYLTTQTQYLILRCTISILKIWDHVALHEESLYNSVVGFLLACILTTDPIVEWQCDKQNGTNNQWHKCANSNPCSQAIISFQHK